MSPVTMSPTRFDDGVVIPSPSRRPEAQEVGQARALCGQLDLGGTAPPQDDEAMHHHRSDSGQDDDSYPVRYPDGGGDGGQVGDPQPFDPLRHSRQDPGLRRRRSGRIGHEREPGSDQALARTVVGAGGAAAGQDDPHSEEEGSDDGGDH